MDEVEQAVQDAGSVAVGAVEDDGGEAGLAPSKPDPAAYTRHVVDEAVERYDSDGPAAAFSHFSSPDSVDGRWYVFVVDSDGAVLAHPDDGLVGESLLGWVGTEVNG